MFSVSQANQYEYSLIKKKIKFLNSLGYSEVRIDQVDKIMQDVYKDLKGKRLQTHNLTKDVGLGFAEKWLPENHGRKTAEVNLMYADRES